MVLCPSPTISLILIQQSPRISILYPDNKQRMLFMIMAEIKTEFYNRWAERRQKSPHEY